jgi:hypothetical protein
MGPYLGRLYRQLFSPRIRRSLLTVHLDTTVMFPMGRVDAEFSEGRGVRGPESRAGNVF